MNARDTALARLRAADPLSDLAESEFRSELAASGIRFCAIGGPLEVRWRQALAELAECVRPIGESDPVLHEGGVYHGAWIESTGTINAEVLSRFAPVIARRTQALFARHQRDDGLIPYKVTGDGPAFSQIQIVTPLARTVWRDHLLNRGDLGHLRTMYDAMARMDAWLATHRDTRGTGAVEAFCTFDTGHDLSPRFWFAPDRCFRADAALCDPESPTLPYLAPDLTANVACQRGYLALIAEALGEDPVPWRQRQAASLDALWTRCFDEADGLFYDRDRHGRPVRIASDVLLRVLACEVGDDDFFAASLERHLMHTGKFLSRGGFTSLAMDDPRFDHDYTRNSWGGPVNLLSQLRAPDAFEHHDRVAELAVTAASTLAALADADRFPQCLDPWTGAPGYTEVYSPSILWFLDAVEHWFGILPRFDGEVWFTGLAPTRLSRGAAAATAYRREIDGTVFELAADDEGVVVHRAGAEHLAFPRGWRVITDRSGEPTAVVGVLPGAVAGTLRVGGHSIPLSLAGNERVTLAQGVVTDHRAGRFVGPHS